MRVVFTILLFLLASSYSSAQSIVINEVLTSNSNGLADEFGENPDWIELYNKSNVPVDLAGYGLTDDATKPFKWVFGKYVMQPNEYLPVYASERNLHATPFSPDAFSSDLIAWFSASDINENDANQVVVQNEEVFLKKWLSHNGQFYSEQTNTDAYPRLVQRALGEYPAVRFDGLKQFLKSNVYPPAGNQSRTIIVMLANANMDAANQNSNNHILHYGDYNNAYGITCKRKLANASIGNNYWGTTFYGVKQMDEQPRFISAVYENNCDYFYVNGEFCGQNYVKLSTGEKFPLQIASRLGSGAEYFAGDIAEIVIFNKALTREQRRQVENFLAKKYNLPFQSFHTNFKLSDAGETVTLTQPDGATMDQIVVPALSTDQSYGLASNGEYAFFTSPTPGAVNAASSYTSQMNFPLFSHDAGFYTNSIQLTITSDDPNAEILYTLDGSIPDVNALDGTEFPVKYDYSSANTQPTARKSTTMLYKGSILIDPKGNQQGDRSLIPAYYRKQGGPNPSVGNVTVVRAICRKQGAIDSRVVTQTFFVDPLINNRFHLPVISVVCPDSALFDYNTGIYVPGARYDKTRDQTTPDANFMQGWERPAHFEIFSKAGEVEYVQNASMRVHGNFSTNWPRKSLRFDAKKRFGSDAGVFNHAFFPGLQQHPFIGQAEIGVFNSFLARNSGNNWATNLFHDAMAHQLVRHLNCNVQDSRAVIHFLNGEYWGIMNMRENFDEYYFSGHYNINPTEVIIANAATEKINEGYDYEYVDYSAIEAFCKSNQLSDPANYEYLASKIDIDNYLTHFMIEIYVNNTDFLGNNRKIWKKRTSQYFPNAAFGHDGRWRWITYDLDQGFAQPSYDRLSYTTTKDGEKSTVILRSLLEAFQPRNTFINMFCDQMNTTFLPNRTIAVLDSMKADMALDIDAHIARWGSISKEQNYASIANFFQTRPSYMRKHLKDRFNLSDTTLLTVNSTIDEGTIKVNTIHINESTVGLKDSSKPYPWTGSYFAEVPVQLVAIPKKGYVFSHWSTNESNDTILISLASLSNTLVTAYFKEVEVEPDYLIINEVNYASSPVFDAGDWVEFYNPQDYTLDISGWCFKDDNDKHSYIFPDNTKIPAQGYIVLCESMNKFTALYPEVGNYRGDFDFGLGSAGDHLRLYNDLGVLIDQVQYKSVSPWPTGANDSGSTIELINHTLDNGQGENWVTSPLRGTPGRKNSMFSELPALRNGELRISVYPNPCVSESYISLPEELQTGKVSLTIYNALGMQIRYEEYFDADQIVIKREGLSTGMYILQLHTEKGYSLKEILIME